MTLWYHLAPFADLTEAIRLYTDDSMKADAYEMRSQVHRNLGDLKMALKDIKKAMDLEYRPQFLVKQAELELLAEKTGQGGKKKSGIKGRAARAR